MCIYIILDRRSGVWRSPLNRKEDGSCLTVSPCPGISAYVPPTCFAFLSEGKGRVRLGRILSYYCSSLFSFLNDIFALRGCTNRPRACALDPFVEKQRGETEFGELSCLRRTKLETPRAVLLPRFRGQNSWFRADWRTLALSLSWRANVRALRAAQINPAGFAVLRGGWARDQSCRQWENALVFSRGRRPLLL